MPTLKLTDRVGLTVNVELPEDFSLSKYIKDLRQLKLSDLDFAALQDVALDKVPVGSATSGVAFEQPLDVGAGQAELKIKAGASGRLTLFRPKDKQLFDPEVFGDPVPIGDDRHFVSLGITASVAAGLSSAVRDLGFGFEAGGEVSLAFYRQFAKGAGGYPSFVQAIQETAKDFTILGDLDDLASLRVGSVATVEGSGSLKFSAEAELLSVVNPLVSVNVSAPAGLPVPGVNVNVVSGNSITVGASFELTGAYQVRAHKLTKNKLRLGFHKRRGTEFGLKVSASGGLTAGVGSFDLLGRLLEAVSADPEADKEALQQAGLSAAQIAQIEKTIEAGIARRLELALSFELNSLNADEAAFLYDIDLAKLDAAGRLAVHQALDANLSALADEKALPAGVTLVRSIFTATKKRQHTFKLNLLGIFNFISVSTLVLQGTVMFEPESGELVITDKATATRISASTFNFAADQAKLRKVLAESFLVTAAYKCSRLAAQAPALAISHSYFELHSKTNRETMKNNLDVVETLGLITKAEKNRLLGASNDFGRTMFYAETGYGDELVTRMFLAGGRARAEEEYERAGRAAIKSLVQAGEPDEHRRLPAVDDALWREMKRQGQFNFRFIDKLRPFKGPRLSAIESDYTVILWWAREMRRMGERLARIRDFLAANPGVDPENNTFKSMRRELAEQLKEVAARTKSQFGDPWGLVAMDLLTGQSAAAQSRLTGPRVTHAAERAAS